MQYPTPTATQLLSQARIARRAGLQFLFVATLLSACGGGSNAPAPPTPPPSGGVDAPAPSAAPTPPTPPAPPTTGPVQVVQVASGLANPWGLAFLPDGNMLVTEKAGTLRIVTPAGVKSNPISGVPAVDSANQGGLLDVVLDPAFASNQRIYFSFAEKDTVNASLNGTAVARAELDAAGLKLNNVTVIYQQLPKVQSTGHYGSRLVFDTSGHLFVTMGERQNPAPAQDLTFGHGKVVRITTNGDAAPGNPVVLGSTVKGLWSWGHRNPQGAALHPTTGELWTNEHGPQGGDELNRTLAGNNYGWPIISYGQQYGTTTQVGEGTAKPGMEQPLTYWETRDGSVYSGSGQKSSTAPSGMAFYTGDKFPEWKGNVFVGALAGKALWRLTLDGNTVTGRERLFAERDERIRDVRQGPDGFLYLLTDAGDGKILRVER